MPDVREGENRKEYMDRCMSDSKMGEEFGNPSQRAAVCNSYFEDKKGLNAKAGMEDYIFSTPEGAKKKSMEIGFNGEIHSDKMADGTMMYFPARTEEEFQEWFDKNDSHDASYDKEKVEAAEYQGKKVTLNKPFRTQGGKKKFAVYVQNPAGRVIIVRFGDPNMEIKRDDPKRRKAFRDRHDCANKKDRTKAGYWSCRQWRSGNKVEASETDEDNNKDYPLWFDIWSETEPQIIEAEENCAELKEDCGCGCSEEKAIAAEPKPSADETHGEYMSRCQEAGYSEEECMAAHEGHSFKEEASHYDDEDKKKMKASECDNQCPIGEEMVAGSCQPVNVTMEATIDSISAKIQASTGRTILEIKGVAFHEGFNKNHWAITKRGAEATVEKMIGADLTLNHPKAKDIGFERNMNGGVDEANVGVVTQASIDYPDKERYEVRYAAHVYREELFEALESGLWLKPDYGVSIGGYGIPISANEKGMVFDMDFTFDHLAIVHKPAYNRATIETVKKIEKTVEAVQYGKPSKNDPRKTPAKPDERRKGSKKNKPDSAKKPNKSIVVSPATRKTIRTKMQEHNKKGKGSKASMGALLSVFRRGAGAFSTSHAPNMSRNGWGIARVNAFLYLLRNGRPSNPNYKQDNDLLPKGHSRAKRTSKAKETFISQSASRTEYRKGITDMSDEEIVNEENVSASEMEALQAELVLARAELEEMKAMEASKHEEARLELVASANELGLKGHEDLSSETLTSLIASWEASRPATPVVEMKPAEPAMASETPPSSPVSEKVVANYLNGKIVKTPESLYEQAWNAWASAWNKTLSGGETTDERIRAPKYTEL